MLYQTTDTHIGLKTIHLFHMYDFHPCKMIKYEVNLINLLYFYLLNKLPSMWVVRHVQSCLLMHSMSAHDDKLLQAHDYF